MARRFTVIALAVAVLACGDSSGAPSGAPGADSHERAAEPGALPSKADSEVGPAAEGTPNAVVARYDDGSFSVAGLRERFEDHLRDGEAGKEIVLTAYVQEIYSPPDCQAEAPGCEPAKYPHLWVVDSPDIKDRGQAMLVADIAFEIPEWDREKWEDQPRVVMEVGHRYAIRGLFVRQSESGFEREDGLFALRAYRPEPGAGWVDPPGAPWHPETIATIKAENAARLWGLEPPP